MMFCFIITAGFKSSLIAHLTVQGKTKPIDSMHEMIQADNWRWGMEPWMDRYTRGSYFSQKNDPVIWEMSQQKEVC